MISRLLARRRRARAAAALEFAANEMREIEAKERVRFSSTWLYLRAASYRRGELS